MTDVVVLQSLRAQLREDLLSRLDVLQKRSIERLESLTDPNRKDSEGKPASDGWYLMHKEMAAHRTILGDLLAGQIHAAKRPKADDDADEDDQDSTEAAERALAEG